MRSKTSVRRGTDKIGCRQHQPALLLLDRDAPGSTVSVEFLLISAPAEREAGVDQKVSRIHRLSADADIYRKRVELSSTPHVREPASEQLAHLGGRLGIGAVIHVERGEVAISSVGMHQSYTDRRPGLR